LRSTLDIRQADTRRRRLTDQGFPDVAGCRWRTPLAALSPKAAFCPPRRATPAANGTTNANAGR